MRTQSEKRKGKTKCRKPPHRIHNPRPAPKTLPPSATPAVLAGLVSSGKSWKHESTTPGPTGSVWRCRVTHPFHPWNGRELEVFEHRQDWTGDRVYFHDEGGCLRSVPAGWTDVGGSELFEVIGRGRARFRIDDLIRLVELIESLRAPRSPRKKRPGIEGRV